MVEPSERIPTPLSEEQLARLEPTARDALRKAAEELDIAQLKAREAARYLSELRRNAQVRERSPSPEAGAAEEGVRERTSATQEEPAPEPTIATAVRKGALPAVRESNKNMEKELVRTAIAKLQATLEAFKGESDHPEELVAMWAEVRSLVDLGLKAETVLAVLRMLPDAVKERLMASPPPTTIDQWRQRLDAQYISGTSVGIVAARAMAQQREPGETAEAFIVRVKSAMKAAVLVGAMTEEQALLSLWTTRALGDAYCRTNRSFDDIEHRIVARSITTLDQLSAAVRHWTRLEQVPTAVAERKVAAPAVERARREPARKHCEHCMRTGHEKDQCWSLYPELNPRNRHRSKATTTTVAAAAGKPTGTNNEGKSNYSSAQKACEVFVVSARLQDNATKLGLDSMAAINLIRADALPRGTIVSPGGPQLHGVGLAMAKGTVVLALEVGGLKLGPVTFAVVETLPVPALLGKPTLSVMGASMDLSTDTASLAHMGRTTAVRAVAVPVVRQESGRPQAQSYWNWINKRFAAAPKKMQTLVQDVLERADDEMLEQFLATFPDWALRRRQTSDHDDPTVHPAPYQPRLVRPTTSITSGVVVCPATVKAADILPAASELDLVAEADDNKDFLPPVMTYEEDDCQTEAELARLVDGAELSTRGKEKLAATLLKHRAAFGMQLRKVDQSREKVHTHTTGELPAHQPRRPIRDPRVMRAQMQWEDAMMERGVIGPLTSDAELARPINIHHVIRKGKIRFTADARTLNEITIPDSHPVPSPMEALEHFRRNQLFSTFDEADSYFQYPYDEESRVPFYSAHGGVREFRVVIQGGKNSPAALHRFKAKQYSAFAADELAFMFDDTLLGTSTESEEAHLALLDRFLATCVANGTILKPSKAHVARREVVHQGFVLSHGHYRKDPEAIRPLVDMRMPTTASELKSQMSMLGRYRHFVATNRLHQHKQSTINDTNC